MNSPKTPPFQNKWTLEWLHNSQEVCPSCHENFNSTRAGDAHRNWQDKENPHCVSPESVGLIQKENHYGTKVWKEKNVSKGI